MQKITNIVGEVLGFMFAIFVIVYTHTRIKFDELRRKV